MKVALVHDYLIRLGGAERVLAVLAEMFPDAPIYTLLYDEEKTGHVFPSKRIRASTLNSLPCFIKKHHRLLVSTLPRTVEQWDFSEFDLVISSSNSFAHGVITPTHTRHISYTHSPMRFAWDWTHEYLKENHITGIKKIFANRFLKKVRIWDSLAADRVDTFIANSQHVARRIEKYYRKPSTVIYPPVDIERFTVSKKHDDFFLIINNITPYKRIDLAVQLFSRIRKKMVIIGEGPQKKFLESIAGPTIEFLGFETDEICNYYLQRCRALIFPGEEDFGITPVEAAACGKPVIAYGEGGVRESVIEGMTGEFFYQPTVASLEDAVGRFIKNEKHYDPELCAKNVRRFAKEIFVEKMKLVIDRKI